jgi:predicted metal-dependent hydrolase
LSAAQVVRIADGAVLPLRLVIRPRARSIGLRVDPVLREVVLVAPHARAAPKAMAFAQERAAWIEAQLAKLPPRVAFAPDAIIPVHGRPTLLQQQPGRSGAQWREGPPARLEVACPAGADFAARTRRALQGMALVALEAEAARAGAVLGVAARSVRVKEMRSRWGSCSSTGALAFSWRVILAPPAILRYLAAHEVAHLREMNHSRAFWALVAQADPGYRAARMWLRREGLTLHAFG